MVRCKQYLDYAATHQDVILSSNIVLIAHSDASYLSELKACSQAGGHFFLSLDSEDPINNGAVLNLVQIIKNVMSSAAEAELGTLYINTHEDVLQCHTLAETGHKQPLTPMQTNNSTALGVVDNYIQPRCTKAMDMRFHWLQCCKAQQQFGFFLHPGPNNRVDYWNKHHCTAHHIKKCPKILTPKIVLKALCTSEK
jgi:hypothetical protein